MVSPKVSPKVPPNNIYLKITNKVVEHNAVLICIKKPLSLN
ncbi:hypothetical protein SAMN05421786_1153 [Chryseobacterium ureilyticum]|uniref:Uncharacterized protein n=1 Tax=Chryseobacterium ureilyticum TaxID=373668 RepID=A0A1N7QRC4_9FLAO|nr:hypothetical protein SAMN05421786_1153 [Chryseobacterium ureilyticum]